MVGARQFVVQETVCAVDRHGALKDRPHGVRGGRAMIRTSLRGPVPAAVLLASVSISTTAGAASEEELLPRDRDDAADRGEARAGAQAPPPMPRSSSAPRFRSRCPGRGRSARCRRSAGRRRASSPSTATACSMPTRMCRSTPPRRRAASAGKPSVRVAFPGRHLRLIVGIGYEMPYANTGFVPDSSLSLVL